MFGRETPTITKPATRPVAPSLPMQTVTMHGLEHITGRDADRLRKFASEVKKYGNGKNNRARLAYEQLVCDCVEGSEPSQQRAWDVIEAAEKTLDEFRDDLGKALASKPPPERNPIASNVARLGQYRRCGAGLLGKRFDLVEELKLCTNNPPPVASGFSFFKKDPDRGGYTHGRSAKAVQTELDKINKSISEIE